MAQGLNILSTNSASEANSLQVKTLQARAAIGRFVLNLILQVSNKWQVFEDRYTRSLNIWLLYLPWFRFSHRYLKNKSTLELFNHRFQEKNWFWSLWSNCDQTLEVWRFEARSALNLNDGVPFWGLREALGFFGAPDYAPRGILDGRVASLRPEDDAHRRDRRDPDLESRSGRGLRFQRRPRWSSAWHCFGNVHRTCHLVRPTCQELERALCFSCFRNFSLILDKCWSRLAFRTHFI